MAILVVPNLIQNYQERATVTKLKAAYSSLDNAFNLAVVNEGTIDGWGLTQDKQGALNVYERIKPYLRNSRISAWPGGQYKYLMGRNSNIPPDDPVSVHFQLSNGVIVTMYTLYSACSVTGVGSCAWVFVDVNGANGPNTIGKDTFLFGLYITFIAPQGFPKNNYSYYSFDNACDKDKASTSDADPSGTGLGCAAWVIYKENMDYLHCSGLSWNGKNKCD